MQLDAVGCDAALTVDDVKERHTGIVAVPVSSRKRPVRAGPQERSSAARAAAILRLDVAPAARTQPALGNSAIIVRVALVGSAITRWMSESSSIFIERSRTLTRYVELARQTRRAAPDVRRRQQPQRTDRRRLRYEDDARCARVGQRLDRAVLGIGAGGPAPSHRAPRATSHPASTAACAAGGRSRSLGVQPAPERLPDRVAGAPHGEDVGVVPEVPGEAD